MFDKCKYFTLNRQSIDRSSSRLIYNCNECRKSAKKKLVSLPNYERSMNRIFFFCHLDWTNNCTKCDGFFPSGSLIADKKNEKKAATICEASLSAECTHLEMSTNGKSDDDPLPSRIRPEMNKNCFCDECEFFVMFFNGPVTDYRETCTNFYLRITIMKDNSMFVCVNI